MKSTITALVTAALLSLAGAVQAIPVLDASADIFVRELSTLDPVAEALASLPNHPGSAASSAVREPSDALAPGTVALVAGCLLALSYWRGRHVLPKRRE